VDKVSVLSKYMPADAAPVIARWIDYFQCEFKVSRNRTTKYGDYRHPYQGRGHRISVNYNLNSYAFLVTTVHEFAHLLTWNEYKRKAKPHGSEWKANFKKMMRSFFDKNIFPPDVQQVIIKYLENPSAASCTDLSLSRVLQKYDAAKQTVTVETLPINSRFRWKKDRIFRKEVKIRTRYRCIEIATGRVYLFNPLAEVYPESS
jgi:SprT protein